MSFSPKVAATIPTHPSSLRTELIQNALTLKPEQKFPSYASNYQSMQTAQASCTAQGGTFSITGCAIPPPPPPVVVEPPAPVYVAPVYYAPQVSYSAGNLYDWGQCTWYVKNRRPDIPSNWGNAGSWLYGAQADGFATGYSPRAGAIGTEGGHVVYIESVNGDGTVNVSEMNWNGGIGVVHYRTTSASEFIYIY